MEDSKLDAMTKNLNITSKSDINILLLGSTGVGKSTMINSFANYLTYGDLKQAKKDNLIVLIPSKLNIHDKHGEYHLISTGDNDNNEYLQTGESATQDVRTYVFPIWNGQAKIRLIDTPGMGDTRGIKQDDINSENILSYISNLNELHAICYLFKPNECRQTTFFKYCVDQIFSRLDKSASDNIIFCFTNTRGTDYGPGETVGVLKKTVEEIGNRPPYAKIPFDKNIFCFDNEPYRYLAAIKEGIEISSDVKQTNKDSWEKSAAQCWKLIKYIVGDKDNKPLKPHFVKSTNAINEARRMINQLSKPLAEIMQLIHHNMAVLSRHKELLAEDYASLEEMKSKLYIPVITLNVTQMDYPATVCTARKCAEIVRVAEKNSWNYKQKCHRHCNLTNVGKEQIGDPNLIKCSAMKHTTTCTKCQCDYRVHMHIYYTTTNVEKKEKDENMQMKITNRFELMESKEKLIGEIEKKQKELTEEHKIIVENCAKFAHFLQNNAITPFSDSYKDYIEYLIDREKSLGAVCDKQTVDHLQQLLLQYVEIKNRFDEALNITKAIGRYELISSKEIYDIVQILYKLKHNGQKIRELYNCQKKARTNEFQYTEYVHKRSFKPTETKEDNKKDKKGKRDKKENKNEEKKNKNEKRSYDTGQKNWKERGNDDNCQKNWREKGNDYSSEKIDRTEKRNFRRKGSARNASLSPSYNELQYNQKTFRNQNRDFGNRFNQDGPQFPQYAPQGYPHGSQFQPMNQYIPETPQLPSQGGPFSPQVHLYPAQGCSFPHNYNQHRGFSFPSHSVYRNNEQGVRPRAFCGREFRGRSGINKRNRKKKGKGDNYNSKGNTQNNKNEKIVSKQGSKENKSSSSSDSSDSSSSYDINVPY